MTQTSAILWKEWRQMRNLSLAGLAVFLAPAVTDLLQKLSRHGRAYTDAGEGMVLSLGGVLAIFLAIALTSRDLHGPTETFWRSRPIGVARLILVKFIVGVIVLLAITLTSILVQMVGNGLFSGGTPGSWARAWSGHWVFSIIAVHSLTLVLLFSVSFLIGCLVRNAAQSAILSVAAGLLIYFLPMLVRPLSGMSVFAIMLDWTSSGRKSWTPFILFVAGTLACVQVALLLALAVVGRQWRIRADQRLIYWSLCGVLVLLLGTMSMQVRPNMALVARTPMAPGWITELMIRDGRGVALLQNQLIRPGGGPPATVGSLVELNVHDSTVVANCPITLPDSAVPSGDFEFKPQFVWPEDHPECAYVLQSSRETVRDHASGQQESVHGNVRVTTVMLGSDARQGVARVLPLPAMNGRGWLRLAGAGDRLFVFKQSWPPAKPLLAVIDIARPGEPSLVESREIELASCDPFSRVDPLAPAAREYAFPLVPVSGLSVEDAVRLSHRLTQDPWREDSAWMGDILVCAGQNGLATYRLKRADYLATLERIGEYRTLPIERVMHIMVESVVARGGLVCVVERSSGGAVTVYDICDPARPWRVGHYAVAHERFGDAALLADGRLLLAGTSLSIVQRPE